MLDNYIGKLYKLRLKRDIGMLPECIYPYSIRSEISEEFYAFVIEGNHHFWMEGETEETTWISKNNLIRYYELVEDH